MSDTKTFCAHAAVFWYAATNEDGWACGNCDCKLGFRPDLDRRDTVVKVNSILHDLHDHTLVYVSNSTHGEIVAAAVAASCREADRYDQGTIIRLIVAHPDIDSGAYWRDRAGAWLAEHVDVSADTVEAAGATQAAPLRAPGVCAQCKTPLRAGAGHLVARARLCDTCAGEIKNYWVSGFTGTGKAVHS